MEQIIEKIKANLLEIVSVLPSVLLALTIIFIGWLISRLFQRIIEKGIRMTGIDELAERLSKIDLIYRANIKILPSKIISSIVYYVLFLIFIMTAIDMLGMTMLSTLMSDLINYIPKAFVGFVILILGIFLADFVKDMIATACRSLNIPSGSLISNVVFYFIFLNVVLISLRQAELQTAFMETNFSILLAGVAAAFALGYGLASKDIMANLLASFYNKNKIEIGDEISIDGHRGEVIEIGNNNITLRAAEKEIVVPFQKLSKMGVVIHSRRDRSDLLPPHEA